MTPRSAAIAEFVGIGKQYPGRGGSAWAVRGVDLRIEPGEVLGLIGPNRAGKTTLVKLLLSLCRPTEGWVDRFGRPGDDRRTLGRVGYVHEAPAFPRDLTATGLMNDYGALSLVPRPDLRRRVPALLERVGLADRAGEPIGGFSKGMVRRLALAQALVNEPDLLVLDEPMEGLDLAGRALVNDLIDERRELGKAALLIAHAPADVERLCDRVAVLIAGTKVFEGRVADLASDPATGSPRPLELVLADLFERSAA